MDSIGLSLYSSSVYLLSAAAKFSAGMSRATESDVCPTWSLFSNFCIQRANKHQIASYGNRHDANLVILDFHHNDGNNKSNDCYHKHQHSGNHCQTWSASNILYHSISDSYVQQRTVDEFEIE